MHLGRLASLACASVGFVSQMAMATGFPLSPMEEPMNALTSPTATISPVHYDQFNVAGATSTISLVTATPLLCANTSTPFAGVAVNTVYYSAKGKSLPTPLPFVFGANSVTPNTSAQAIGASQFNYTGAGFQFTEDGSGSLVCYGLDANGVRRMTRDLFKDAFDGVTYNSNVTLSVLQIPGVNSVPVTAAYVYTIDVTIPPLPLNTDCSASGLDCKFALLEGYDTSVFSPSANGAGWCLDDAGSPGYQNASTCPFNSAATSGDINVNYGNFLSTVSLAAPVQNAGGTVAPVKHHFVVFRYLRASVGSVPAAPVAIASLFSPADLEENKLDDNVSAGNNSIANAAPSVASDAAWTTFSNQVAALTENTDSGTLSFNISDADTPGALTAAVTLNLPGGVSVAVTPTCSPTSPPSGGAAASCTLDIPFNNAAWWNTSVGADLQNQFNAVATDVINGSYASGLSASLQVVATDAGNKSSAPVSLPVHIFSKVNNAPVVSAGLSLAADSFQGGAMIPTYSCSIISSTCGSRGYVDLAAAFTATPGPVAAFDELVSQTTAVNPYTGAGANGGNVQCVAESGTVFLANGNPVVQASATANTYDTNFFLANPLTTGSSLCTVTITDQMTNFPNGESAKTTTSQFRIVVGA